MRRRCVLECAGSGWLVSVVDAIVILLKKWSMEEYRFVLLILSVAMFSENNCYSRSWYPGYGWIQCNLWLALGLYRSRQHRSQSPSIQATVVYHSRPWRVCVWSHPIRGNSLPVNNRWQAHGWLSKRTEHRARHQGGQGTDSNIPQLPQAAIDVFLFTTMVTCLIFENWLKSLTSGSCAFGWI